MSDGGTNTMRPAGDIPGLPLRTIWVVVNLVNVLQAIAFAARPFTWSVQRAVGIAIAALAVPATLALVSLVRTGAGWRFYVGPLMFDAFAILLILMEHVYAVDWRARPGLPALLLGLFFGSILLMGAPMFRVDRRLWTVTALTAALLGLSMAYAALKGVA